MLVLADRLPVVPQFGNWGPFVSDGLGFALKAMGHEMQPEVAVARPLTDMTPRITERPGI
jgi:hypothetical protein